MLIDDAWCDLFLDYGVRVGVSIDGPASLHDKRRRTRSGAGTHALAMRGVDRLKRRGVPFHVITVVTKDTLECPEELAAFYRVHGMLDVAFNIEEVEGINLTSTLNIGQVEGRFREFFGAFLRSALDHEPPIALREWRETMSMLANPAYGRMTTNSQDQPFAMVTVSSCGEMFTFSPELAGINNGRYGTLSIGRLPGASLSEVLASRMFRAMWRDVQAGIKRCRENCLYFNLCLGGAPANKLAECGTFDAAEALYCRLTHKAVSDVVLTDFERRLQQGGKLYGWTLGADGCQDSASAAQGLPST
jgi:uncharacterized protein